jgi:hypothetical protein
LKTPPIEGFARRISPPKFTPSDARTLVEHSNTDYEQQPHKQQRVKARALVSAPAAWKERFGNYHSLMWTFADRPDSE